jgi:hypothetical protein
MEQKGGRKGLHLVFSSFSVEEDCLDSSTSNQMKRKEKSGK